MMPDNTQDDPNADARQQRMAAMLGILSGVPGFSNFGKTVIGNQDQQLSGQSQALDDNINQNLKIGQLVQGGQERHDTLMESMRYHNMEDQERQDKLSQQKAQQGVLDSAQSNVDAIGQYKAPLPNSRSTRGQAIIDEVYRQYPDYDSTKFDEKKKAQTAFATGPQGNQVRSADVSIAHLDTADQLAAGLDNSSIPAVNSVVNFFKTQSGSPDVAKFNAAKSIVSDEINKFIIGGGGALADREQLQGQLNAASSPAQLNGVTNTLRTLMAGQLKGLQSQFVNSGLGTGNDFLGKLQPRTVGALGLSDAQHGSPGVAPGPQGASSQQSSGPMRVKVDAQGNVIGN